MAKLTVLGLALFSMFYSTFAVQSGVPVLIWSNKELKDLPDAVTGHTASSETFHRDYLSKLVQEEHHTILLFVQDKLSVDDITKHADVYSEHSDGAAFHNLKALMEGSSSAHLPSVSSPGDALRKLQQNFEGKVHSLSEPYTVDSLVLDELENNLVVVNLPQTKTSDAGFHESLKYIDGVMGSVSRGFDTKKVAYTAIYTAEKSSRVRREEVYTGRHLLAEEEGEVEAVDYFLINETDCLLFYARNITIQYCDVNPKDEKKPCMELIYLPVAAPESFECHNGSANITYAFNKDIGNFSSLEFNLRFQNSKADFWKLVWFNVKYETGVAKDDRNVTLQADFIQAPTLHSYHCTTLEGLKEHAPPQNNKTVRVNLLGFQAQFGPSKDNQFGRANDCVGFFSIGALAGLTVALVLTLVLAFGLALIMNISTMDRFDDPKGKTIAVITSE